MGFLKYNRLFSLKIKHDFYANLENGNKDFVVAPTSECKELLANFKILFRNTPSGFTSLFKAFENDDPFTEIVNPIRFVFALKLENKIEFMNFTDLTDTMNAISYAPGKIIYFRNISPTTVDLNYELLDFLSADVFTYEFILNGTPANVILKFYHESDLANAAITYTGINADPDNVYHQAVDLRGKKKGKYIIKVRDTTDTSDLKTQTSFVDPALAGQDIFGIIGIDIDQNISGFTPTLPSPSKTYDAKFTRRTNVWKYYVVDKNNQVVLANVKIDQVTNIGYGTFTFNNNNIIPPYTGPTINGFPSVYLLSDSAVPFTEAPEQFQLTETGGTVIPLIDRLPNPSPLNVSEETNATSIFVYV